MDFPIRMGPSSPEYGEMLPATPDAKVSLEEFQIYQTLDPSNSSPKKRSRRHPRVTSQTVAEAKHGDSPAPEEEFDSSLAQEGQEVTVTVRKSNEELLDTGVENQAVASARDISGESTPLEDLSHFEDLQVADTPLPELSFAVVDFGSLYARPAVKSDPSHVEGLEFPETTLPELSFALVDFGLLYARLAVRSDPSHVEGLEFTETPISEFAFAVVDFGSLYARLAVKSDPSHAEGLEFTETPISELSFALVDFGSLYARLAVKSDPSRAEDLEVTDTPLR